MLNGQNMATINKLMKAMFVPFGEDIVHAEKGRKTKCRKVGKCITSITDMYCVDKSSGEHCE
jgi:hypothetical protein